MNQLHSPATTGLWSPGAVINSAPLRHRKRSETRTRNYTNPPNPVPGVAARVAALAGVGCPHGCAAKRERLHGEAGTPAD